MKFKIYSHPQCLKHEPGPGHPESPLRLESIITALENHPCHEQLEFSEAPLVKDEQILLAHCDQYLSDLKQSSPSTGYIALDADTIMSTHSLDAAYRAAGAVCQGLDDLLENSVSGVFCATRPPGHHATSNKAMGFCLLNQVAIGALYAKKQPGLSRIAVMDFDVHHGNGSQDILQGQDNILYISTHQSPLYPGSGLESENIEHNIFNLPLQAGTDHGSYCKRFEKEVMPVIEAFRPDLILVSAGFDAHLQDPLAGLCLTDETYYYLGKTLQDLALQHCQGRILSSLEGGYDLGALSKSVNSYISGLLA